MFETCDKYGIKLCSQTAGLTCHYYQLFLHWMFDHLMESYVQDFVLFRKTDEGDAEWETALNREWHHAVHTSTKQSQISTVLSGAAVAKLRRQGLKLLLSRLDLFYVLCTEDSRY